VRIRTRLTVWYIAIFSMVMLLYVCGACMVQYWQLTDQLFHEEVEDMETVEGLLYFSPDGRLELNESYHSRPENKLLIDRLMEVRDPRGIVLFRSGQLKGMDLGGPPRPGEFTDGHSNWRLRLSDGRHVLGVSHRHPIDGTMLLFRIAYSTDPLRLRVVTLFGLLMLVLPLALILAGVAGYHFAGKTLNPLKAMACRTEQITAQRLNSRIPVENSEDEFGQMARVLNELLQRLEESFSQLQRFTSDVSHELRTPLTSMRSVGEVGLQRGHTREEYRDIIGSMLEEVARLTAMIDTLLTIAHADAGATRLDRTVFPIMDLVEESVSIVGVLAEDKGQGLLVTGDTRIWVSADRGFLRMAVINLLDNAVKYSPSGSTIRVVVEPCTLTGHHGGVRLAIQDEGPGIPPDASQRVFDRFYRLDEGRARDAGGAGLGLAIAKWSVEAHGGDITVISMPGAGATFAIQLPVIAEATS
jgi:heavy metal sensor kinase